MVDLVESIIDIENDGFKMLSKIVLKKKGEIQITIILHSFSLAFSHGEANEKANDDTYSTDNGIDDVGHVIR